MANTYIGVNGVAQQAKKIYVGVNGIARNVKSIYVGVYGVARNVYSNSGAANPDDYFDPNTHIATEANFIAFLEAGGKYDDTSLIGYKVTLSNSATYNGGTYVIADVNHDSTNTGQTNCYDLIALDCVNPGISFGSNYNWRDSNVRTWLNGTFYNGLSSDIKSHIINIKYNSQGTWYNDDKVILPSFTEVNGSTGTSYPQYADIEGIAYPIFTNNNSRSKYQFGTTSTYYWWTRSRYAVGSGTVWRVVADGSLNNNGCTSKRYVVPTLRIS